MQPRWRACVFVVLLALVAARGTRGDTDGALQRLERKYRIAIVTRKAAFPVTRGRFRLDGRDPRPDQVRLAVELLRKELTLYPLAFIRKLPLRRIVICRDLTANGKHIGGWADYSYRTLYLNGARISADEESVRHALHHEIFHLLDIQDDGDVAHDPAWEALNPSGYRYGANSMEMLDDLEAGLLSTACPGFLNRYSTSALAEDKAEVYSYLVTAYPLVEQMARNDPVIAAKVAAIKQLVRDFHPDMDERFWRQFRVEDETRLAALRAVKKARETADEALSSGDLYGAFRRYKAALYLARRNLAGPDALEESGAITRRIAEILKIVTAPLKRAEQAIAENEFSRALDELDAFAARHRRFLAIAELRNKYETLCRHPSLRPEKRERSVRERIRAGDAALERGDPRTAARWYRSAARVFPDTRAAREAREKLDRLLADPAAVAEIEKQNAELECKAMLGRGRLLMKRGQFADAVAVFDDIIALFPDTPWARQASLAREECAERLEQGP